MRILLVAGGWSEEREVSLQGARQIQKALNDLGYETKLYDLGQDLNEFVTLAQQHDFIFLNLHGTPGEDGSLQALLEDLGLPFQGSKAFPSYLCLNKSIYKQFLLNHNLPTPKWTIYKPNLTQIKLPCNLPVIIKPNLGGSSLGIKVITHPKELSNLHLNPEVEYLVEEFIPGQELTCGVLGDRPLPPVLIQPKKSLFFDYKSKYDPQGAEEICPAPISDELTDTLQHLALKVHKLFHLSDYSRTDFIVDRQNKIYILETNTLPGMTPTSLLPKEAKALGLDFKNLIATLVKLGLEKKHVQPK
ncbi:MAG: D-alanine--D-alanine ligase [Desulfonauticus sp.]|nr:D-alanine--D-alanine ligase [Desulfonauticus sp.]